MKAQVGDWVVVESPHVGEPRRVGLVTRVSHADGTPPYLVRWTEDDHESLTVGWFGTGAARAGDLEGSHR